MQKQAPKFDASDSLYCNYGNKRPYTLYNKCAEE